MYLQLIATGGRIGGCEAAKCIRPCVGIEGVVCKEERVWRDLLSLFALKRQVEKRIWKH